MFTANTTSVPLAAVVSNHTQESAGIVASLKVAVFPVVVLVVAADVVKLLPAALLSVECFN